MKSIDKKELAIQLKNLNWASVGIGLFLSFFAMVLAVLSNDSTAFLLMLFITGVWNLHSSSDKE